MNEKTSREMVRGNLDLMVLSSLSDGAKYGYLIQQSLCERSSGMVDVQAGTLYPILHKLEAAGLVRSRWDAEAGRRRKWYELTTAGEKRLVHQAQQWRDYAECLWRMLAPVVHPKQGPGGVPWPTP